jgi:acyl carrier protein
MSRVASIELVVLEWLRESSEPENMSVDGDTKLLELEVLDSLSILQLVGFIEERFEVAMPLEEFVPDNFSTPKTVAEMIARRLDSVV